MVDLASVRPNCDCGHSFTGVKPRPHHLDRMLIFLEHGLILGFIRVSAHENAPVHLDVIEALSDVKAHLMQLSTRPCGVDLLQSYGLA